VAVLWQYAGPILLMSLFGVVYALTVFAIAPWCFRAFWFERALFTYGWNTGVVGYGVALLRVVDPQYKSHTLEDYGTACLVISPIELLLYPAIIWACASGFFVTAGITLTVISLVLFLAAFRIAGTCRPSLPVVAVDSMNGQTT
jgi:ESS family glutamate:Na+ symporter